MNFVGWLSKKSVLLPSLLPSPWQQGDTAGMLTTSSHQDWQKDGTTRSSCKSWKTATWRTSTVFPEMSQCRKWDTHWETLTLKLAMRCDVVLLWPSQVLDGWLQRCEQREELPSFSRNVRALGKTRKALHYIYYISVRNLQLIRVCIFIKKRWVYFRKWWTISPPFLQCLGEDTCTSHIGKSRLGSWTVILVWRNCAS